MKDGCIFLSIQYIRCINVPDQLSYFPSFFLTIFYFEYWIGDDLIAFVGKFIWTLVCSFYKKGNRANLCPFSFHPG